MWIRTNAQQQKERLLMICLLHKDEAFNNSFLHAHSYSCERATY